MFLNIKSEHNIKMPYDDVLSLQDHQLNTSTH